MKKLFYCWVLIGLFACKSDPKTQPLNQMSQPRFEMYLLDHVTKRQDPVAYVDSLLALPTLKKEHQGKIYLWKMSWYMAQKDYQAALKASEKLYQINEGKQSALLVSYYYHLGRLHELQNKIHLGLYYYNKAAEILKKTNAFYTTPMKADALLLSIAQKNKYYAQYELANRCLQTALNKYKNNDYKSHNFNYQYNAVKASLFASASMLDKDSVNYYLSQSEEGTVMLRHKIDYNLYIKAEYFFNANQIDSSLYYLEKISSDFVFENKNDKLNLLSIYSRQNDIPKADDVLSKIKDSMKRGEFDSSDSLLYLGNVIDYHIAQKDYPKIKKSLQDFMTFRQRSENKETKKNINELSSILDLQYKDEELRQSNTKYVESVRTRNIILIVSIMLLLVATIIGLYLRSKATKRRLILEKNEVDLKMKLLQSQINPHFIFNSLGAIQSLIRQEKNKESINYLNKFSGLLRQTLNVSREMHTTLEKELQVLRSYVEVQQLRKDNFDIVIELDDKVSDIQSEIVMPTLSLQPFVENAILHGFKGIDYRGEIWVSIVSGPKSLHITIKDNGIGLQAKKNTQESQKSHGIDIIREQIEILGKVHRFKTSLKVDNRTDTSGVVVGIRIPLILS